MTTTAVGTNDTIAAAEYFIDPTLPITPGTGTPLSGTLGHTATLTG